MGASQRAREREVQSVCVFVCGETQCVPVTNNFSHTCVCVVTVCVYKFFPFSLFVVCVDFHPTPPERNEGSGVYVRTREIEEGGKGKKVRGG